MDGIRPMLIYPLGGILLIGILMCAINPLMGAINTGISWVLNSMGGSSKILLGCVLGGMMSVDMGGPINKAAYVFGTAALSMGQFDVMAAVMIGGMASPCYRPVLHVLPEEVDDRRAQQWLGKLCHGSVLYLRRRHPVCGSRSGTSAPVLHRWLCHRRRLVYGIWLHPAGTARRHLCIPDCGTSADVCGRSVYWFDCRRRDSVGTEENKG